MYNDLPEAVQSIMTTAAKEATQRFHEYIGTEHMLLALITESPSVCAILRNQGVEEQQVRIQVSKIVQAGPKMPIPSKLPLTPRGMKVIEYGREEAKKMHCRYVTPEHVLLGLMREAEGVAAQIFIHLFKLEFSEIQSAVATAMESQSMIIPESERQPEPPFIVEEESPGCWIVRTTEDPPRASDLDVLLTTVTDVARTNFNVVISFKIMGEPKTSH